MLRKNVWIQSGERLTPRHDVMMCITKFERSINGWEKFRFSESDKNKSCIKI